MIEHDDVARPTVDTETADAMNAADNALAAIALVWRAIRLVLRPFFPERPIVRRSTREAREFREAA